MNTQSTFPSYIERLKAENQELLDRIADLEAVIFPKYVFPAEWKLTFAQRRCLSILLASKEHINKSKIYNAIWDEKTPNVKSREEPNKELSIEALINRIRYRAGIDIKTLRYKSYFIDPEETLRVLSIIKPETAA